MSGLDVKSAVGWAGGAFVIGGATPAELAATATALWNRDARGYINRADAYNLLQTVPSSVHRAIVVENGDLVVRGRDFSANDPLFDTGFRWGVAFKGASVDRVIAEVVRASNAEAVLSTRIDRKAEAAALTAETSQRTSTDESLQQQIDTVSTGIRFVGDWNASGGAFPIVRPGGGEIQQGDSWNVQNAGTVGGVDFAPGDILTALVSAPGSGFTGNWTKRNGTATQAGQVTTSASGVSVQDALDIRPLPFASRSEAEAASILGPVHRITIAQDGELIDLVDDVAGTALTTADGRSWSPASGAPAAAWGAGRSLPDNVAPLNAASAYAVAKGVALELPAGVLNVNGRWTMPAGLTARGKGRWLTVIRVVNDDRVIVMGDRCRLHGVHADANNMQVGPVKLSAIQVSSDCGGSDIRASGAYTNIAFSGVGSSFHDVLTEGAESRGVIFGIGAVGNKIIGLTSQDNGNAGVIFGQGAHDNAVYGVNIQRINLNAIWFVDGAHDNLVEGGFVRDPANPNSNAIVFLSSARNNTVRGLKCSGYQRAVIMQSGPVVDGAEASGNLYGNKVEDCDFVGLGAGSNSVSAVTFARGDASLVDECAILNCRFSDFAAVFENSNTAIASVVLSGIRSRNIGSGRVFARMKAASGQVIASNIQGLFLRRRYLSEPFDIATAGNKTIVIPHGLGYTPPLSAVTVTLQRESLVTDFRVDHMWPATITATDITLRVMIGVASTTAGALARVSCTVDMEAENGFQLASLE